MSAEIRLQTFIDAGGDQSPAALLEYYDTLDPIGLPFMFGAWEGGVLATGHEGERRMRLIRWVGKTFHSVDEVDPIISRNAQGGREVNPVLGDACLRMIEFRGVVSATMVYDKHPLFDYFRKISEDLVMGVMDHKGQNPPLFFYLRRRNKRSQGATP
ncbi:DUF4334 domain-containing protein [Pseudenhygromyxa sp. WMMC2535]|uniref:DUF4334 domain-containing protein n=1 Tax=Pseudenhygromyxa sp. WMMC2535 TaxID=2712867 RepID=UPI001552204C|nr:DUF4334 domain-containing protein [Pseudenhygromyxa sp. WMMC2535]NVB42591.1 DUF4334 domain-containing protein [Pseudenhygromyxa sp. WMMC2535]